MQVAVSHDGTTLTSTSDTEADIHAALGLTAPAAPDPPADDATPAAPLTAPAADADADEDDAPDADAQAASEAGKTLAGRKRSFQARISELNTKRKAAEDRAAVLAAELDAMRRTVPAAKPAPQEQDFSDYAALEAAQRTHAAEQVYRDQKLAEQQAAAVARAQAEETALLASYQDRLAAVVAAVPDFEATVNQPIQISSEMRLSIFESEVGPQLAYWFGKHPDEAARVSALRGSAALREIGKIEARLDAASHGPAPRATSSAPPPIKPLGGGASSTASKLPLDHPDVSFKEYAQRREAGER